MSGSPWWVGAVLCGGQSRRMGSDKALLVVDGQPMVRRVAVALQDAGAHELLAVGGDLDAVADVLDGLDVRVVADRWPSQGPLGGLLTALGSVGSNRGPTPDILVTLACDLVTPSPEAVVQTVEALSRDRRSSDVAVPVAEGRRQWLHTAWRRHVASSLATAFDSGSRAIHRAVTEAGLSVLEVDGIAPAALRDADAPEDLEAAGHTWTTLPPHDRSADRRT